MSVIDNDRDPVHAERIAQGICPYCYVSARYWDEVCRYFQVEPQAVGNWDAPCWDDDFPIERPYQREAREARYWRRREIAAHIYAALVIAAGAAALVYGLAQEIAKGLVGPFVQ